MRILINALVVAFALGALASGVARAGEGCAYESAVKKNDFETPPPASATPSVAPTKG